MLQLDLENTALTRAASLSPEKPGVSDEDNLDTEQIVEKITQLRKQLKTALENSESSVTLASELHFFLELFLSGYVKEFANLQLPMNLSMDNNNIEIEI